MHWACRRPSWMHCSLRMSTKMIIRRARSRRGCAMKRQRSDGSWSMRSKARRLAMTGWGNACAICLSVLSWAGRAPRFRCGPASIPTRFNVRHKNRVRSAGMAQFFTSRPSHRHRAACLTARFLWNSREAQIAVDIEGADVTFPPFICRLPSSMVEQLTLNAVWML
jgi:hypothetical protein